MSPEFALGGRYRLTYADLDGRFTDIPSTVPGVSALNQDESATLHQVHLYGIYNHWSGAFGQASTVWSHQSNHGYAGTRPGDDFWQFNVHVGYRFLRRHGEVGIGLLNITDRDYRLNPLTLYNELPRERTLVASLKFYF